MSSLFLVATPIGNLKDITARAVDTLKSVDVVAAEDTRVAGKLLHALGIEKPLLSYHQHTTSARAEQIFTRLEKGEDVALVTDAGTPGISDPGGKLVSGVVARFGSRVTIVPIPGPCALVAALCVCGFPSDEFVFLGFPPHKKGRNKFFDRLPTIASTIVFYESTHRIMKTLAAIDAVCPARAMTVCRELTKLYETIYRGTASQVTDQVKASSMKGEFVVVLCPSSTSPPPSII